MGILGVASKQGQPFFDYDSISITDTAAGIGPAKSASPGYLRFSILFPDVLVDITDVSLDRKSIDHKGKHHHISILLNTSLFLNSILAFES